jgi:hypothetical protein
VFSRTFDALIFDFTYATVKPVQGKGPNCDRAFSYSLLLTFNVAPDSCRFTLHFLIGDGQHCEELLHCGFIRENASVFQDGLINEGL